MANFTPEQEQAIFTHNQNLIVVAGAGSGKTRVLVERYLDLLDKNRDWRLNQLVAITFTQAAALEMRDRVRRELENRVQHAENDEDRRRWSDLLGQMDSARIDTIHAMCATILRANAAEAQIDPGFDVVEPVEAESMLSDIIDAQLQALADNDTADLAPLFTEYDMRDIRAALANQELLALDLSNQPTDPEALFEKWRTEWETSYFAAVQRANIILEEALEWQPPSGRIPDDDKIGQLFFMVYDQWEDFLSTDLGISNQALDSIISGINLSGGSGKKWDDAQTRDIAKDVMRYIRDTLKDLKKSLGDPPAEYDEKAAKMLVRWIQLLQRVQTAYQHEKAVSGYLDFNDLEQRAAQLLSTKQAVRQRYQGQEFKRLLVDEFQDTNQAQWDIVQNLVSLDDDVAMFLVGDPKQSIYAFRGADVSVFDGVRHTIDNHPNGRELDLTVSFRSHPGLITAFNALFAEILTRDETSPVATYEIQFDQEMSAFRQELPDQEAKSYAPIELLILRNTSSRETRISADDRRIWEAVEIGNRIQKLRADQAPVHDKEDDALKAFDYGDAAILFRSTSQINTYEQIFKAMGIPFVTLAGRGYYNRQEVWDILNLLKALHNPADNLSLAVALRSPMFGFSDEMLLALRLLKQDDERKTILLWDALQLEQIPHLNQDQLARVHHARVILQELRTFAGRVTISELLRVALAKTGYLAALTGLQDGARLRRNVEKLVDIAEQSGKITLGAFSHYLNDLSDREVREGEATLDTSNVVRLMTVHASKGLEFPVVFLADAGWKNNARGTEPLIYDSMTSSLACKVYDENENKYVPSAPYREAVRLQQMRDDAESKRLLYVAATRARDCLIISGELKDTKSKGWTANGWMDTVRQVLQIDSLDGVDDGYTFAYTPQSQIRLNLPEHDPMLIRELLGTTGTKPWQQLAIEVDSPMPSLMRPVQVEPEKMLGHIAATQLANIGGYHYSSDANAQDYYRSSVRRHILDDSPPRIREAVRTRDPRVSPRQLGEVVHEALRYWRFPNEHDNIDAILQSYAWQQNITDESQITDVVERAHRMLDTFQRSDLYNEISKVRQAKLPYYAELPFIYRTQKRIIHGIIDVLFKNDDAWWIVDYKTSTVRGGRPNIQAHARRYHLQLGAYASAVRQELGGEIPRVFVHYIQYNQTVEVPTNIWETEIQKLENYIGELIG